MANLDHLQWLQVWATAPAALNTVDLGLQRDGVTFENATVRQTVRINAATDQIRLNVSNLFGVVPLGIEAITVAVADGRNGTPAGSASIILSTLRAVSINSAPSCTIAPRCSVVTDTIPIHLEQGDHLSISIYTKGQRGSEISGHFIGKTNTWIRKGDCTRNYDVSDGRAFIHWFWITSVEALIPQCYGTIQCFGDSITDTLLATNTYAGWADGLARGLDALGSEFSVLNLGISGDRLCKGGIARFPRDILMPSHGRAGYLILHIGINDLGFAGADQGSQDDIHHQLIATYEQVCRMAHERNMVVIGSTIMPFLPPPEWPTPWEFADPRREPTRQKVNRWILSCGLFNHIIDFSAAVTDPEHPERMCAAYHNGDYLHPSVEGYKAMLKAINLDLFK